MKTKTPACTRCGAVTWTARRTGVTETRSWSNEGPIPFAAVATVRSSRTLTFTCVACGWTVAAPGIEKAAARLQRLFDAAWAARALAQLPAPTDASAADGSATAIPTCPRCGNGVWAAWESRLIGGDASSSAPEGPFLDLVITFDDLAAIRCSRCRLEPAWHARHHALEQRLRQAWRLAQAC